MLISWNMLRDFLDLPGDVDPRALTEKFTRTTAEVDQLYAIQVGANGLIAARVLSASEIPGTRNLRHAVLDLGNGATVETVTAAPVLHEGCNVVYAPDGATVSAFGKIHSTTVGGKKSVGMILPGEALGIAMAMQEAVFLDHTTAPGEPLPAALFDDWVIEIDNKSITHRPDLWGHYGVAREMAAICGQPLKPYPVAPLDRIVANDKHAVEISIADAVACPRYSALVLEGVPIQPAPLWMQLRLGHIGMRPISGLVDLTNYIMAELGQPMHAFDAGKVPRIEVNWATGGERFTTLDGMERKLTTGDLMIQCEGKSIALAGVMGGLETEVSQSTATLLLESANFNPTTIRKTAGRLALRTDASARFEKSLDPGNTVLGIQRFVTLATTMYPNLVLTSTLSDCYPKPAEPVTVRVNPAHITRTIGQPIPTDRTRNILEPLGFLVSGGTEDLVITVPSFRATGDVSIEADVIEEIARYVGYNTIEPALPAVHVRRFEPNALHELEQRTLECFSTGQGYNEIHGYLWYDDAWLDQLGVDAGACVELANPAAEGLHQLRRSLMPAMLAAITKNRFHYTELALIELGSVFEPATDDDHEFRHVGLVRARRGKRFEGPLFQQLKGDVEAWAWQRFTRPVHFSEASGNPKRPWEHPQRTADVIVNAGVIGRASTIDLPLRRAMDEHLGAWSIAWAELRLGGLENLADVTERLGGIPAYPLVEMDFSVLVPKQARFDAVTSELASFQHPLLRQLRFVDSYEGEAIAADSRSLTYRTVVGDTARTLVDEDTNGFCQAFEKHLTDCGYRLRR